MPVNPKNLLSIAHSLLNISPSNEDHFRSASNRAYYCAFHECSLIATSQLQKTPNKGAGQSFGHKELFDIFLNHVPPLKVLTPRDKAINTIGYLLKQTRDLRVHADYKNNSFSKNNAIDAINNTNDILRLIKQI